MLNGSKEEPESDQTAEGEKIDLSEKPEAQEFVIDKAEIETRAQMIAETFRQ